MATTMIPKNPAHPGAILKDILFDGYGLTLKEASKMLGVSAAALSNFLNEKTKISFNLAHRLDLAGINSYRFWLALQSNYDYVHFYHARKKTPVVDLAKFEKIRARIEEEIEQESREIDGLIERKLEERERERARLAAQGDSGVFENLRENKRHRESHRQAV